MIKPEAAGMNIFDNMVSLVPINTPYDFSPKDPDNPREVWVPVEVPEERRVAREAFEAEWNMLQERGFAEGFLDDMGDGAYLTTEPTGNWVPNPNYDPNKPYPAPILPIPAAFTGKQS